ncbi:MAG: hypothetical protein ABIH18_08185 [Candidatus Omnitrophota bacterium]
MFKKKGQSTLEYVIILTAIIGVVLVFAGGMMKENTKSSLEHVSGQMQSQVKKIVFTNPGQ